MGVVGDGHQAREQEVAAGARGHDRCERSGDDEAHERVGVVVASFPGPSG